MFIHYFAFNHQSASISASLWECVSCSVSLPSPLSTHDRRLLLPECGSARGVFSLLEGSFFLPVVTKGCLIGHQLLGFRVYYCIVFTILYEVPRGDSCCDLVLYKTNNWIVCGLMRQKKPCGRISSHYYFINDEAPLLQDLDGLLSLMDTWILLSTIKSSSVTSSHVLVLWR